MIIPQDKNKMYIHIATGTITNKFWFAELPIYSNIVTESRYVSGFSKYSLRS